MEKQMSLKGTEKTNHIEFRGKVFWIGQQLVNRKGLTVEIRSFTKNVNNVQTVVLMPIRKPKGSRFFRSITLDGFYQSYVPCEKQRVLSPIPESKATCENCNLHLRRNKDLKAAMVKQSQKIEKAKQQIIDILREEFGVGN
jgi:hypothetical protein